MYSGSDTIHCAIAGAAIMRGQFVENKRAFISYDSVYQRANAHSVYFDRGVVSL